MPYDPNFPPDHQALASAPWREQFQGLKALVDALSSQLAPITPQLSRTAGGVWTVAYNGPTVASWLVWARNPAGPAWANFAELNPGQFPTNDSQMTPGGAWWQVKICGENLDLNVCTPFSNVVSFGPVPV